MNAALTEVDRDALARVVGWPPRGQGVASLSAAVEGILGDRFDRWEWNYGERVKRLESERADLRARLAATEIKLAAARLALAACREVREARES